MPTYYGFSELVENETLGKQKILKAASEEELSIKVRQQLLIWNRQEIQFLERQKKQATIESAEIADQEAKKEIESLDSILLTALGNDTSIDWERLKNKEPFPRFSHNMPKPLLQDFLTQYCVPHVSFWNKHIGFLRKRREKLLFQAQSDFKKQSSEFQKKVQIAAHDWELKKAAYDKNQQESNLHIDMWRADFEKHNVDAINGYFMYVISNSALPSYFPANCECQYDVMNRILLISYQLPSIEQIPSICGYKYVTSKKCVEPIYMKKRDYDAFYDTVIRKTCLRLIHEAFLADYINSIDVLVFNGWINAVSKSNGSEYTACILSVQVSKEQLSQIHLDRIDVKECLRSLKALYAGSLAQMVPVNPIMDLNITDRRFIASRQILDNIQDGENLATMDWADFEHLVRELFAKFFTSKNAEVRVTQSSRDGGVDAIAFDPDPIRGGKYVIQAKRYNIVVPVSAVRDLYGTMINEGAAKGILVTTSHFGNDSREFAKDKPISLIDGNNLLAMFRDFGYNFHIKHGEAV